MQVALRFANTGLHGIKLSKFLLGPVLHKFRVEDEVQSFDLVLILKVRSIQNVVLSSLKIIQPESETRLKAKETIDITDNFKIRAFLNSLLRHNKLQLRVL